MTGNCRRFRVARRLLPALSRLIGDRRGNIGVMTALLIVPLVGALGMATEASGWFLINRAEQSAADSAALAAASNNDAAFSGTGYISEAKAVASKYGFTDGSNNTTISVTYQTVSSIPACVSTSCYVVQVAHNVPLALSGLVGYTGNVALGSGRGEAIAATAVAIPKSAIIYYCLTSLRDGTGKGGNPDDIRFNGAPNANFAGCTLRSNGSVKCNGHDGDFKNIIYRRSDDKCEPSQEASSSYNYPLAAQYQKNIPADSCKSYSQETKKGATSLPNTNLITQLTGIPSTPICGDAALSEDVTLSGANNVLVIDNGVLDLNGHTLKTAVNAGLTIVFSGNDPKGSYSHYPTGNGTLDIAAPASGSWSGVAIWQDTALTGGVDITYSGNSPAWDLTGLVYLPKANVTLSGAVGKSDNGISCFALVDYTLIINGTGSIFANSQSQCTGNVIPNGPGLLGAKLVF